MTHNQIEHVRRCIETHRPVPWKLARDMMDERRELMEAIHAERVAGGKT